MSNKTINLSKEEKISSFLRDTGEMVNSWFRQDPVKKESICTFIKKNNLRCLRSRKLPNGKTRISVLNKEGKEHFADDRNFVLAYLKLRNNFYGSNF